MALILGMKEGRSFFVGDTKVTVEEVVHQQRFKVRVHGAMDKLLEVDVKQRVEILTDVFVSAGKPHQNRDLVQVAIEAPRHVKVLRDVLYRKEMAGGQQV